MEWKEWVFFLLSYSVFEDLGMLQNMQTVLEQDCRFADSWCDHPNVMLERWQ